eukprot:TRINITY_DN9824_c0_g1_i1.p1 TRINITY_DN9824_c0_g1~~TRINITY_DN9824_c0_g1_i1.p1  ORF type:complete len:759 (+),score=100.67 TRINITY_DN9824_c0_g1_i1:84-2279(+)
MASGRVELPDGNTAEHPSSKETLSDHDETLSVDTRSKKQSASFVVFSNEGMASEKPVQADSLTRKGGDSLHTTEDSPNMDAPRPVDAEFGMQSASCCLLSILNDEVQNLVLSCMTGADIARSVVAVRDWLVHLTDNTLWKRKCLREFYGQRMNEQLRRLPVEPLATNLTWKDEYQRLHASRRPRVGAWCSVRKNHGLGDRVAQPQFFVGPSGQRLFCYGGWTRRGARTDLLWASLSQIASEVYRPRVTADDEGDQNDDNSVEKENASDNVDEGARGVDSGRVLSSTPSQPFSGSVSGARPIGFRPSWSFHGSLKAGTPANRAGVQTLTTLWFQGEATSEQHISATAAALKDAAGVDWDAAADGPAALVLAYGGALGGYQNEQADWAVGVLHEAPEENDASKICWGKPPSTSGACSARGAHTATFVPARLAGAQDFPEGCVFIFGGHTDDCQRSLSSVQILSLHDWTWHPEVEYSGRSPGPRHGHSCTLVEVNGKGYLVVVGGGIGNILSSHLDRCEFGDVAVFDVKGLVWLDRLNLIFPPGCDVPGRHHTASMGLDGQILLFGGGSRSGNCIGLLDGDACVKQALSTACPRASTFSLNALEVHMEHLVVPPRRKMHAAVCLLPWLPLQVVFGGWDSGPHFDDFWVCALGGRPSDLTVFRDTGVVSAADAVDDEEEDLDETIRNAERMYRLLSHRFLSDDGQGDSMEPLALSPSWVRLLAHLGSLDGPLEVE